MTVIKWIGGWIVRFLARACFGVGTGALALGRWLLSAARRLEGAAP